MNKLLALVVLLMLATQPVQAQRMMFQNAGANGVDPPSRSNPLTCDLNLNSAVVSSSNPLPTSAVSTSSTTATYAATTGTFTPAATATDMAIINGSATKTVKVLRVLYNSIQTTTGVNQVFLIKRSAANTGGTAVGATEFALDSTNAAVTAVVQHYTAEPTPGAAVGTVRQSQLVSPKVDSVSSGAHVLYDAKETGQPIVLRGVAQGLAVNFGAAAIPAGMTPSITYEWSEE